MSENVNKIRDLIKHIIINFPNHGFQCQGHVLILNFYFNKKLKTKF